MASVPTEAERLKKDLIACFEQARVPDAFQKHAVETLKMESVEDFVSYVKESSFEDEIEVLVKQVDALKDDRLAVARTRTAWKTAHAALRSACSLS